MNDLHGEVTDAGGSAPRLVDARPLIPRRVGGIWDRSEQARSEIFRVMQAAAAARGHHVLVIESAPFVHPAWVKFECWLPRDETGVVSRRATALITLHVREYHRWEIEHTVDIEIGGRKRSFERIARLSPETLEQLVACLLAGAALPALARLQLRKPGSWTLWKPLNTVTALRRDWSPSLVAFAFAVFACGGAIGSDEASAGTVGLLVVLAVAALWALARRQVDVRTTGRPGAEPRSLIRMDSWQTVVTGLGLDTEVVRAGFLDDVARSPLPGLRHWREQIWYWGLEGKEEREQLVLSIGRVLLFCHIYRYDNELYVGWDVHLNRGQWVESPVATGIDRETRRLTRICTVVPGSQPVNEYDVTDLNCLSEWAHAKLTSRVRHQMELRRIDQEIDFRIVRGDRTTLSPNVADGPKPDKPRRAGGLLRRTG